MNPEASNRLSPLFAAILLLIMARLASAEAAAAPQVAAELRSERTVLAPGTNWVALSLAPQPGWHSYWRNPGDAGQATTLEWSLPEGYRAGDVQWPTPSVFSSAGVRNLGYADEALHLVAIDVPETAIGRTAELRLQARWLACKDICIPEQASLVLRRPVAAVARADETQAAAFGAARLRLPQALTGQAQFRVDGRSLHLQLENPPASLPSTGLQFLAYEEGLLDLGQATQLQRTGSRLELVQALAADATLPAGDLPGILLDTAHPGIAWQVEATPGTTAATAGMTADAPAYALVLLLAFAGGLILNLMPCVFPVLSLKAVSLLQPGGDGARQRKHALVYTAGAVLSCVSVAALLLALRAGGAALGWGFQLQSPLVVALLAYLMFALGLSLSGALELGSSLMGLGQGLAARDGYAGSFFTGVLAVVVASPCTAPFMGTALGFAVTQPWPLALAVFALLGLGLASPFLLLALWPAAARRLPRPGAWMERFKQAMAFPLYFTAVWLLWVLGRQAGLAAVMAALCGLVLLGAAIWALSQPPWLRRSLAPLSLVGALGLAALPASTPAHDDRLAWEPYSDARLETLRRQGQPVFVNLTADWCLTCKVNERVALETEGTRAAFAQAGVQLLKGDWTRSDPAVTAVLARHGRNGVPLYLVFRPGAEPLVLPQLLTPSLVRDAILGTLPSAPQEKAS